MPEVITSDGVRLHVEDHASTGGPAGSGRPVVVLVAGFTAAASTWVYQVEALTAAGYRAVVVDRRNHGASQAVEHGQRIARHGRDVHEVLRALALDDVVVVGGSMGASTAWSLVDLHGTDGLRGLVSIDQTPRMLNDEQWQHGFYGLEPSTAGTLFAGGVPATGRGLGMDRWAASAQRLVEHLTSRGLPAPVPSAPSPGLARLLHDHAAQDWRDVVARCPVPQLLVAARDSQFWPCEHATAAVAGNPQGRSLVIDDCGHAANTDRPEAVNAAVLEFLADL